VQCLDVVSPCAGWTRRSSRERDISRRLIANTVGYTVTR
jgi:hypothetical protein